MIRRALLTLSAIAALTAALDAQAEIDLLGAYYTAPYSDVASLEAGETITCAAFDTAGQAWVDGDLATNSYLSLENPSEEVVAEGENLISHQAIVSGIYRIDATNLPDTSGAFYLICVTDFDLAVTSGVLETGTVYYPGDQIQFRGEISNLGTDATPRISETVFALVDVEFQTTFRFYILANQSVPILQPGETMEFVYVDTVPLDAVPDTYDAYSSVASGDPTPGNNESTFTRIEILELTAPTIDSFSAAPATIETGDSIVLSWTVSLADSCSASGGAGGWAGSSITLPSGSQQVTLNEAGQYTFTLSCSNESGGDSSDVVVTVEARDTLFADGFEGGD